MLSYYYIYIESTLRYSVFILYHHLSYLSSTHGAASFQTQMTFFSSIHHIQFIPYPEARGDRTCKYIVNNSEQYCLTSCT